MVWGEKNERRITVSFFLVFLILGFIRNQGRRSDSYQLFLHSSANSVFLVQSYGYRNGRRQRHEHICYIFSQCDCEVVTLNAILKSEIWLHRFRLMSNATIYFCLSHSGLVQSVIQGGEGDSRRFWQRKDWAGHDAAKKSLRHQHVGGSSSFFKEPRSAMRVKALGGQVSIWYWKETAEPSELLLWTREFSGDE